MILHSHPPPPTNLQAFHTCSVKSLR